MPRSLFAYIVSLSATGRRGLAAVLALAGLAGCSAERDTQVARRWHNLLAHYNGYFIGREKVREVEATTWKGLKDNYNKPLPVLPAPGSAAGQTALLDEAVKKGSIPIQRHKNSDWVDDSYLVIGKARYYQDDYENAVHTFKWVNSKGKDPEVKHMALVWLLRTYTDMREYTYARAATEAVARKPLSKRSQREFYQVQAHYHYSQKEWPDVLANVEAALPLMHRNMRRARLEFLAGQLRQRFDQPEEAYAHYRYILRCRPTYEMSFQAKLAMAQVAAIDDAEGVARIQKYFRKLLTDEKNEEYKDKIYYEMGRFELRQKHVPDAIKNQNASLRANGKSQGIKGLAYLQLGQIYYEQLRRFDISKLYYDSTVAALDTTEENYKAIVKRQKVLTEFVKEYQIITHEDSLRRLADMDSSAMLAIVDRLILEKAKADAIIAKAASKAARQAEREAGGGGSDVASSLFAQTSSTGADAAAPGTGSKWYFYDQAQIAVGKSKFQRKWGRRPLEDNWRLARKELGSGGDADGQQPGGAAAAADSAKKPVAAGLAQAGAPGGMPGAAPGGQVRIGPDGKPILTGMPGGLPGAGPGSEAGKAGEPAAPETQEQKRAPYLKNIPFSPAERTQSDLRLRMALYNVGKIYDQKLIEPSNAIVSFRRTGAEFGDWDKVPEALYNLYIVAGRQGRQPLADSAAAQLKSRYPQTAFAKLIDNPNYYQLARAETDAAKRLYAQAYTAYKESRYIEAGDMLRQIRARYPENTFADRVDLLSAMLVGQSIGPEIYQDSLKAFIASHPKSDLVPTATQMMEMARKRIPKPVRSAAMLRADSALAAGLVAGQGGMPPGVPGMPGMQPGMQGRPGMPGGPGGPPMPNAPATYSADGLEGPQLFVVVLPRSLAEEEARTRMSDFNRVFFPQDNLTTSTVAFTDGKFLATSRELRSKTVAGYYLKKQESLDGAYDDLDPRVETFIITPANFQLLYRTKDLAGYLRWAKEKYK